jgi:hypothetical protein
MYELRKGVWYERVLEEKKETKHTNKPEDKKRTEGT